jgi:predicted transcriptional regulator
MDDNTLRTDVELLKRDVASMNTLFDKLDIAIEKLADVSNSLNRMLAVHESRLNQQEKIDDLLREKIAKTKQELNEELEGKYDNICSELKDLKEMQSRHHESTSKRIDNLERWRWYLIGGATALGFLLANMPLARILVQ